jgi:hypothetical protein
MIFIPELVRPEIQLECQLFPYALKKGSRMDLIIEDYKVTGHSHP